MNRGGPRILALAPAALFIAACGGTAGSLRPFEQYGQAWPAAPEPARIQFVMSFAGPEDLGIRRGAWDSLVGLIAGPKNDSLGRPMAVATTPAGEIVFVADPGVQCVHRFDLRRGRHDCLTRERGAPLPSPVGVAAAADGRVFVSDSMLDVVLEAGPGERYLRPLALSPSPSQPTGIAFDESAGRLIVASTRDHVVRTYDTAGKLVSEVGGRGTDPGQMNFPTHVWFATPGEILVTDSLNCRIQRFDHEGALRGVFGRAGDASGSLARPKGVATDRYGHVYVVDGVLNALQVFDQNGQLLLALGQQGQAPGEFWLPAGIFVTPENLIFVADSYNRRVQVFRYVGPGP